MAITTDPRWTVRAERSGPDGSETVAFDSHKSMDEAWRDVERWLLKRGWLSRTSEPDLEAVAIRDVAAERRRQIEVEGWASEHDDQHTAGALAAAAGCYASNAAVYPDDLRAPGSDAFEAPADWPWDGIWWKPKTVRQDLVRAAALILAEIERLDRATIRAGADDGE